MNKDKFLTLHPMLLKEIKKPFNSKDYLYELKYDGFRALIFIKKKEIIIKSRNGIILNDIFPELLKIKNITNDTVILDGEIVNLTSGKPNIRVLQERLRTKNKIKQEYLQNNFPAVFICFDILYQNKDLTNLTLINRKKILSKLKNNEVFQKVKFFKEKGRELFQVIKKEKLEGIVAKKINSPYYYGKRSDIWLKIKNMQSDYFSIGGYTKNINNTISLYLGKKTKLGLIYVGKIAISSQNEIYSKVLKSKILKLSPFFNYTDKDCHYITPNKEIFIYYTEMTKNNMLRHPRL